MSERKKSFLSRIIITLLILTIVGLVGFNIFQKKSITTNKSSPNLFERKALVEDIEVRENYNFPTSVKFTITPNSDIDDLELQINFLDSSKKVLAVKYIEVGNVISGKHYEQTMDLLDLDFEAVLTTSCEWTVSRGLIDLF